MHCSSTFFNILQLAYTRVLMEVCNASRSSGFSRSRNQEHSPKSLKSPEVPAPGPLSTQWEHSLLRSCIQNSKNYTATPCNTLQLLGPHHIVTTTRKNSFPQGQRWARIGKQNIAKPHRSQVDWTWLNCLLSCWDLNRTSGYSVKLSPITLDAQCSRLWDTAVTSNLQRSSKKQVPKMAAYQTYVKHRSNISMAYDLYWPVRSSHHFPIVQTALQHCSARISGHHSSITHVTSVDLTIDLRGTGRAQCAGGGMPAMGTSPQLTANHYDFVRPHLSDFEAKVSELIKQLSRFPYKSKQLKKTRRICPNPSKLT